AGKPPVKPNSPVRRIRRRSSTLPAASSPTTLQTFFPRSIPSIAMAIPLLLPSEVQLRHERVGPFHNHVGADRRHRLIRRWLVTDAAAHEGSRLVDLLDRTNTAGQVCADSRYLPR